jgi:hypothetical protein
MSAEDEDVGDKKVAKGKRISGQFINANYILH